VRTLLVAIGLALVVAAAPSRAEAADATAVMRLASEDATVVSVIDVAGARDAPTLKTVIDATGGNDLFVVLADLGVDLADVDTVMAAGSEGAMIAVLEGKLANAVKRAAAAGTRKKHRGVKYFELGEWAGATIKGKLVVARVEHIKDVIDRHKKKQTSAARSAKAAALRAAVAMTDTRHHVWLATTSDPSGQLTGLEGFSIAATATSELTLELRGHFADEQGAIDLTTTITDRIDQVRMVLEQLGMPLLAGSLQVDRADRMVEVDATLPDAELTVLIEMLRRF
jgi:hypothetical protein